MAVCSPRPNTGIKNANIARLGIEYNTPNSDNTIADNIFERNIISTIGIAITRDIAILTSTK